MPGIGNMDDSPYQSLWRMDWGLGNPNKTAALIALIMIVVWGFAYIRKWGFWVALSLFTGFGLCLILTLSRGGAVGLLAGCLCVLAWIPRPWPLKRSISVVAACAALAIFAWFSNAPHRYAQGITAEDRSIDNRLLIWEQVPSMIHDAPNGWGLGRSGDAYMQWYQPVNRGEGYRTLVNSHLTWLTELDWPGRVVYVFGWVAVFILVWPRSDHRWFSIPLGIWVAFAICASFSSVAESQPLWIIPLLALLGVVITRFRQRLRPETDVWLWGSIASSAAVAALYFGGIFLSPPSTFHCVEPGIVTFGAGSPKVWIVAPNRAVLGEHYGHEARRGYEANLVFHEAGLGIVAQMKKAPANQTLVFSGQVPLALADLHPTQIILINPPPPSNDAVKALVSIPKIIVIVGEFSANKDYWDQQAQNFPNIKVQIALGSEDYISDWMQQVALCLNP